MKISENCYSCDALCFPMYECVTEHEPSWMIHALIISINWLILLVTADLSQICPIPLYSHKSFISCLHKPLAPISLTVSQLLSVTFGIYKQGIYTVFQSSVWNSQRVCGKSRSRCQGWRGGAGLHLVQVQHPQWEVRRSFEGSERWVPSSWCRSPPFLWALSPSRDFS